MKPYPDFVAASYWGGGTIVPAAAGGWWSLHARATPTGVELATTGLGDDGRPESSEGWPADVRGRYAWATPDTGGPAQICELDGEE